MMTEEEKLLFKRFISDDNVYKNTIIYKFIMSDGDELLVKYFGEGESETNPFTGDDDYYYALDFYIIDVILNKTNNYIKDSLLEVSKYDFPINIEKIDSKERKVE